MSRVASCFIRSVSCCIPVLLALCRFVSCYTRAVTRVVFYNQFSTISYKIFETNSSFHVK